MINSFLIIKCPIIDCINPKFQVSSSKNKRVININFWHINSGTPCIILYMVRIPQRNWCLIFFPPNKIQGVCEMVLQKLYLISRLFLELETWNFGLIQSIIGHLIIKKWFDHYHLLDISNDYVKNSKISEGTEKTWLFHKIAQNGPKMLIEGGFLG